MTIETVTLWLSTSLALLWLLDVILRKPVAKTTRGHQEPLDTSKPRERYLQGLLEGKVTESYSSWVGWVQAGETKEEREARQNELIESAFRDR